MRRQPPPEYWNHNTAYHPWLIDIAARHRGDVLDVGCGDGLLAQRLAPVSRTVTGIDPDPCSVERAIDRVAPSDRISIAQKDFDGYEPGERTFDMITWRKFRWNLAGCKVADSSNVSRRNGFDS